MLHLVIRKFVISHFLYFVLAEQPGVLATLSRWRSGVRIPSGTLIFGRHGAVRKLEKAAKLKPSCAVGSTLTRAIQDGRVG